MKRRIFGFKETLFLPPRLEGLPTSFHHNNRDAVTSCQSCRGVTVGMGLTAGTLTAHFSIFQLVQPYSNLKFKSRIRQMDPSLNLNKLFDSLTTCHTPLFSAYFLSTLHCGMPSLLWKIIFLFAGNCFYYLEISFNQVSVMGPIRESLETEADGSWGWVESDSPYAGSMIYECGCVAPLEASILVN